MLLIFHQKEIDFSTTAAPKHVRYFRIETGLGGFVHECDYILLAFQSNVKPINSYVNIRFRGPIIFVISTMLISQFFGRKEASTVLLRYNSFDVGYFGLLGDNLLLQTYKKVHECSRFVFCFTVPYDLPEYQ